MTDYKQLCGELLNRLNGLYEEVIDAGVGCVPDEGQDLMNRAWDAMAEPEPEGELTDEELLHIWQFNFFKTNKTRFLGIARAVEAAVIARRPAPVPVPVSEHPDEREGWCDSDGRCWWGRRADSTSNADWFYATWAETIVFCEHSMPQFSLPHDALPLPAGEAQHG